MTNKKERFLITQKEAAENIAAGFTVATYILVVLILGTIIAMIWGYASVELLLTLLVLLFFTVVNSLLFVALSL
jgi:hypothetical protein